MNFPTPEKRQLLSFLCVNLGENEGVILPLNTCPVSIVYPLLLEQNALGTLILGRITQATRELMLYAWEAAQLHYLSRGMVTD